MAKQWRVGVLNDTFIKGKGEHATKTCWRGLPGVDIVGLADPNCDGIEQRMAEIGARKHYKDYREMLEKEHLDAVALTSRLPEYHYEQMRLAAEFGCGILVEKPVTADLEEADRMVALGEKYNVKICVLHLARYALVFRTMKRMIENGDIGRVLTFYARGKEDDRGGGEDMIVLGTHILDIAPFFFGNPLFVYGDVWQDGRPMRHGDLKTPTENVGLCAGDDIFAHFKFNGGVNCFWESRKDLKTSDQVRMGVTVEGTKGRLSMRYGGRRELRLSRSVMPPEDATEYEEVPLVEDRVIPGAEPLNLPANCGGEHRYFVENNRWAAWDLLQAIDENRQPASSIYDARMTLEMIEGVYAAHLAGRPLTFPLTSHRHPLA